MNTRKWLAECHAWLDDPTSVQARVKDGDPWSSVADRFSPMDRPEWQWRIRPATITINGTELPKPVSMGSSCLLLGKDEYTAQRAVYFNTREDCDLVYSKLVEVLGL
jgi:hypothetical protein